MIKNATISDDGLYRYQLIRFWSEDVPEMMFIMLNPSTADANKDDPTIRRCMSFARREGAGGISIFNLFALRSKDPSTLKDHPDPVGPSNNAILNMALFTARTKGSPVVCAWGANTHPLTAGRAARLIDQAKGQGSNLMCLGKTASGAPRHPLYVRALAPLIPYP